MMKNPPTVAALFGLDDIEGLERRPEDDTLWYLFRLDGLLPGEQRLAIDVSGGMMRVWCAGSENAIIAETHLKEREIALVTALLLSHPCFVARYQMCALSQLYEGSAGKSERERAVRKERDESLREVIAACNLRLGPLALAITPLDHETHYQLTAERRRSGSGPWQLQTPSEEETEPTAGQ